MSSWMDDMTVDDLEIEMKSCTNRIISGKCDFSRWSTISVMVNNLEDKRRIIEFELIERMLIGEESK